MAPKHMAMTAVGGLLLLLVGYAAGRWSTPTTVGDKSRSEEKVHEASKKTDEATRSLALDVGTTSSRVVYIHDLQRPDGTHQVDTRSEERTEATTKAAVQEARRAEEARVVERVVVAERIKVVQADRPVWGVAAGVGLSGGFRPVYRGEVEHALFGPVSVGVYATTAKEAGVVVRVRF